MTTTKLYQLKAMESLEEIFKVIGDYHQLSLSHCLRIILNDKELCFISLHQRLISKGYYLSIESLYRYFNPNLTTNRFPSREFMVTFAEVLQLTDEQTQLLLKFWSHCKFAKKLYQSILESDS